MATQLQGRVWRVDDVGIAVLGRAVSVRIVLSKGIAPTELVEGEQHIVDDRCTRDMLRRQREIVRVPLILLGMISSAATVDGGNIIQKGLATGRSHRQI